MSDLEDFRLRSRERELLEIELITMLIVRVEAYQRSSFAGSEWAKLNQTVKDAKRLLGLDKLDD